MEEQQIVAELQATYDYAKGNKDRIEEGTDEATIDEPEQVRREDIAYYQGMMNGVGIIARHLGILDKIVREEPRNADEIVKDYQQARNL